MRLPKHRIKNLVKSEDFAKACEKAVIRAEAKGGMGGDKRNFAIKELARWLDDAIKLPWFLELIDGPAFYIAAMLLGPHIEAAFEKIFKKKPAADPCAALQERVETLSGALAELQIERDQYRDQLAVVEGRLAEALAKPKKAKVEPKVGE